MVRWARGGVEAGERARGDEVEQPLLGVLVTSFEHAVDGLAALGDPFHAFLGAGSH
jgi:hypothetical protein